VSDPIVPEAYRALRSFAAHRRYFERLGKFSEDMMLMCERFRLVEVFAPAGQAS
jgi:uncharacterized protein YhfF